MKDHVVKMDFVVLAKAKAEMTIATVLKSLKNLKAKNLKQRIMPKFVLGQQNYHYPLNSFFY
jgi:hypothetical protein